MKLLGREPRRHFIGTPRRLTLGLTVAATQAMVSIPYARAADDFWDGGVTAGSSTSWGLKANWQNDVLPTSGQGVNFGKGFNTGTMISIAGALPVGTLSIETGTAISLNADPSNPSTPLNLTTGQIRRLSDSSGTQTINTNLQESINGTWQINGATGALVVNGVVSGSAITKAGVGTLILGGSNSYSQMTLTSGTLQIADDTNLRAPAGTFTIGKGTLHTETSLSINRPVKLTDVGTFDSLGTIFLQGGISGTGTLVKTGGGRMRLFGSNSFVGTVINMAGQILTNPSGLTNNIDNEGELQLSQNGSGSYTINISGAGTLIFGGGSVSLSGSNSFSGPVFINDTNVAVSADKNLGAANNPITLSNDATVLEITSPFDSTRPFVVASDVSPTIQTDSGISNFTGPITGSGTLIKAGTGTLRVTNVRTTGLVVNAGTLAVLANGASAGTSQVQALGFGGSVASPSATLDLTNNSIIIDYVSGFSPLDTVRQEIKSAYNSGHWNGAGLTSSSAAASTTHKTALGYAEASAAHLTPTFNGITIDNSTVVIRYTFAGDANLDLKVDTTDFTQLALHFNQTSSTWFNGDFNYDGTVNALDFNILASNFGQNTLPSVALGAIVPEPGMIGVIVFVAGLNARRRTRRGKAVRGKGVSVAL